MSGQVRVLRALTVRAPERTYAPIAAPVSLPESDTGSGTRQLHVGLTFADFFDLGEQMVLDRSRTCGAGLLLRVVGG